jgi:hypothetical protein
VVRAPGAVHAQVVAHDRRVALGALQLVAQRLALLVRRFVALGVALALRERALVLVLVLGGLTRRHASGRRRQVR